MGHYQRFKEWSLRTERVNIKTERVKCQVNFVKIGLHKNSQNGWRFRYKLRSCHEFAHQRQTLYSVIFELHAEHDKIKNEYKRSCRFKLRVARFLQSSERKLHHWSQKFEEPNPAKVKLNSIIAFSHSSSKARGPR